MISRAPLRLTVLLLIMLLATPSHAFWGALSKIGKLADEASSVGKTASHADDAARTTPKHPATRDTEATPEDNISEILGTAKDLGDLGQLGSNSNEAEDKPKSALAPKARMSKTAVPPQSWGERLGWLLGVGLGLALFLLLPLWLLWRGWRWFHRRLF